MNPLDLGWVHDGFLRRRVDLPLPLKEELVEWEVEGHRVGVVGHVAVPPQEPEGVFLFGLQRLGDGAELIGRDPGVVGGLEQPVDDRLLRDGQALEVVPEMLAGREVVDQLREAAVEERPVDRAALVGVASGLTGQNRELSPDLLADLWPQLFSDVNCIALWISSEKILTRLYSVLNWFHKRLEVNIKNSRENLCFQTLIVFSFGSFDNSNNCTVLWKITARLIIVSTSVNNEMWVKLRSSGG